MKKNNFIDRLFTKFFDILLIVIGIIGFFIGLCVVIGLFVIIVVVGWTLTIMFISIWILLIPPLYILFNNHSNKWKF